MNFISKIYKYLILSVLIFLLFGFKNINVYAESKIEKSEKLISCDATLNDDFLSDSIIVTLKHDISLKYKTYTTDDFNEIKCIKIDDLTKNSIEILKIQNNAKKTRDWSKLSKHIKNNMLINMNTFHQILCLTIKDEGKENLLHAIEKLEKRCDIK